MIKVSSNVIYPRALFEKVPLGVYYITTHHLMETILWKICMEKFVWKNLMDKDGGTKAFFQIVVRTSIIGSASL